MNQRAAGPRLLAGTVATLIAVCGFVVAAVIASAPAASGTELPLSSLEALASAGHVETAVLHNVDHVVSGAYLPSPRTTPVQYWAAYPPSDAEPPVLIERLASGGATVSVDPQNGKNVLLFLVAYMAPAVLLASLIVIVLLIRGGARWPAALRLRRARRGTSRGQPGRVITFADVAAADGAIEQLQEVVEYLRDPARFATLGAAPPRGVLLHGPAGCGKGLLALALAGEARARFFATSGGEVAASVDRGLAASPRDVFAQARAAAPAVVFIAEIDAVAGRAANPERPSMDRSPALNHLLVAIDRITAEDGVVIVGATTKRQLLHPAVLLPGRFDRDVSIQPPDAAGRSAILALHARGLGLDPAVDLAELAVRTSGLTGADLAGVISEATLQASRARHDRVDPDDIDKAVRLVGDGPRRRGRLLSADERRRAAVHEAGHAIVASALGRGRNVHTVSILTHGRGLATILSPLEQREVLSRSDLLSELTVLSAGVAAEELYFGEPSTGDAHDLLQATELARSVAGRFGMSAKLGRTNLLDDPGQATSGGATADVQTDLNAEVRRLIDDATAAATDRLQRCHDPLVDLVLQLERDEVVEGVALGNILIRALEVEIEGIASIPEPAMTAAPPASSRPRTRNR
ncbi:MAG TPA: AAA family ATPase [Candidatus Acidoferrales bacterium]|nr:AAA family ATPase [Candidatus Acidoferrales bacterium]